MEPSILFAEFILGMCAIHLIGMASDHVAQWRAKSSPRQRTTSGDLVKKALRSDWYVFFSCSDLYGKEPKKEQSQAVKPADKVRSSRDQRPTLKA
ncbi:MAG: hypothetical protein V2B20_11720 [Pseudomonadota bacterium]